MRIVNRAPSPSPVSTHPPNHHEVTQVQLNFDFYIVEGKPAHLIGDKAYDHDPSEAALAAQGVEMTAPHRQTPMRATTHDIHPLPRHGARRKVEGFFATLPWQPRMLTRWEYYPTNFLAFVQLASFLIFFMQFPDTF